MKNSRFLADYGMIFVLVLLCAFFSVVTYSDQSPTGEPAAACVERAVVSAAAFSPAREASRVPVNVTLPLR